MSIFAGKKACGWSRVYKWLMIHGFEFCRLCGTTEDLTFEHIVPKAFGGTNTQDNITILCASCNNGKGHNMYSFEPLPWPPRQFEEKSGADIVVGDVITYGKVLSKLQVSSVHRNAVWSCDLDTSYGIVSRRRRGVMGIEERNQYIIVPRRYYGLVKDVACGAESSQA